MKVQEQSGDCSVTFRENLPRFGAKPWEDFYVPTGDELTRVTRLLMQQPLEIWNQKSEMMKIFWKEFAESADEEEEYQYENDTSSKKFFPDGYIDCSGGEPVACFYLKDHLGNGRMVIGRCRII